MRTEHLLALLARIGREPVGPGFRVAGLPVEAVEEIAGRNVEGAGQLDEGVHAGDALASLQLADGGSVERGADALSSSCESPACLRRRARFRPNWALTLSGAPIERLRAELRQQFLAGASSETEASVDLFFLFSLVAVTF